MREELAIQKRLFAPIHRVNEAAFLVEKPRYNLLYQLIGIASLLRGGARKFRFEFRRKKDFHEGQTTPKLEASQGLDGVVHKNRAMFEQPRPRPA